MARYRGGGSNDEARSTQNLILERLTIRLEQADDPLAVMAATKRDDIVAHFHRTLH